MKHLTEADIIRLMREEWHLKIRKVCEAVADKLDTSVVSPELKVVHNNSGIRYTVDSVGPRDVVLRTPEGEKFLVDADKLENDYCLD